MDEPPSSALIPREDIVFASASTSASDAPTSFPAPAIRCAIDRISPSVLAPLLPRCTSADASRSTFSLPSDIGLENVPITFANRAISVAADFASRSSTASPSWRAVRVKLAIFGPDTPSAPAAAATCAISSCATGIVFANCRSSDSRRSKSTPSTVFFTDANDCSQSRACLVTAPMPRAIAPPATANRPPAASIAAYFSAARPAAAPARSARAASFSMPEPERAAMSALSRRSANDSATRRFDASTRAAAPDCA